jgi:CRP/FNR family transcriptional regulator, anaerobic regulatory protein
MKTLVDDLTRFAPFDRLSPSGRTLLARGLTKKTAMRGGDVLHKGEPVSGAYVVLSGRLRVFTIANNGTEATLYFVDPGEACVLAMNCLFNDLLYPAWVQAEGATTIALISGATYRRLFESEPSIQNLTVQALSTLVFRLMSSLEDLHTQNHKQRLANFLLTHASSNGELHTTQQRLAAHLGTTREVVARSMRELVAAGYVRTGRGSIVIKDLFGLRRLAFPAP